MYLTCVPVFSVRGSDRRGSDDPQRGVGLDQTPLRVATTSRLGTSAMLGAEPTRCKPLLLRNRDDPLSNCSPIGCAAGWAGGMLLVLTTGGALGKRVGRVEH